MPKFAHIAKLTLAATLLAGCALGPDYQRPEQQQLQIGDSYYGQVQKTPVDENGEPLQPSLALANWRKLYRHEPLQQLIEQALANNLDLESARANLRAAQAASTAASAPLWPALSGAFETERERTTGGTYDDSYNAFGLLSWELDLWGVNRRGAEAGRAEAEAAEYQLYDVQVALIASVANSYFDLLDIDNQLAITRATIETRREAVRILKLRKANGIISGTDVRQAEVALAQALRKVPQLQQAQLKLENQLNLLLGRAPGAIVRAGTLDDSQLASELPLGLPSELLLRRPDLRAAEQKMIAANARIGASKGKLFPSIKLTGEFGYSSSELTGLLRAGNDYWSASADVAQPLFNAGANMANYRQAKEVYQQSLLAYRKSVLAALGEVSAGISAYRLSFEQEQATKQLLTAASDYLRLAILQYQNGVLGYIDVLDAQRQQFDAELSLSQAKRDRLKAATYIYKALGGGWSEAEG